MLNSPFMQTGANRVLSRGLLNTSKFSFNGIVTNLEKTVSTINQVIPLYNQVKPLISNSKSIINVFKKTKPKNPTINNNNKSNQKHKKENFDPNIINVEINQTNLASPLKENSTNNNHLFKDIQKPTKPFFNEI